MGVEKRELLTKQKGRSNIRDQKRGDEAFSAIQSNLYEPDRKAARTQNDRRMSEHLRKVWIFRFMTNKIPMIFIWISLNISLSQIQPLKKASADEQNHAVWFLYFLNKQK